MRTRIGTSATVHRKSLSTGTPLVLVSRCHLFPHPLTFPRLPLLLFIPKPRCPVDRRTRPFWWNNCPVPSSPRFPFGNQPCARKWAWAVEVGSLCRPQKSRAFPSEFRPENWATPLFRQRCKKRWWLRRRRSGKTKMNPFIARLLEATTVPRPRHPHLSSNTDTININRRFKDEIIQPRNGPFTITTKITNMKLARPKTRSHRRPPLLRVMPSKEIKRSDWLEISRNFN